MSDRVNVSTPVRRSIATALAVFALGCSTTARQPLHDEVTQVSNESSACRVTTRSGGNGTHALRFELYNAGDTAVTLQPYEPFLSFTMQARSEGQVVRVHQPSLDIPVRPTTLTVPAGGSVPLETPIRLQFESDANAAADDGFIWTLARSAGPVELEFRLELPPPFDAPCSITLG
jgi:hypothetical protein